MAVARQPILVSLFSVAVIRTWCSRKRTQYQARCRALLGLSSLSAFPADQANQQADQADSLNASESDAAALKCECCGSDSLRFIGMTSKPSWSIVLTHFDKRCPAWYAEQEHAGFREQLEREYGLGYDDWCLEMRIESPIEKPLEDEAIPPPRIRQLYLPGLSPDYDFALESY